MPCETAPILSVVVPVYNGALTVPRLVEALRQLPVEGGLEIVLVNDGSRDDSAQVCARLAADHDGAVRFVDLMRNFGEHNAIMAGLSHARGRWIVTMDDDLQNPPDEVIRLLDHARATDADVVYTFFEEKCHDGWRNWGSRFANGVANILLDKPRDLYLSSFRCLSRLLVDAVLRYDGPFPYVDGLILQATQRIETLQVEHLPRAEGASNYTLRRLIRLWLAMFTNFSIVPLRLATLLGMVMSGVGFLAVLGVIVEWALVGTPRGWSSLMAGLLLFSGVQLLILGLIGEYLGRMFLSANRKPQFLVRQVVSGEGLAPLGGDKL